MNKELIKEDRGVEEGKVSERKETKKKEGKECLNKFEGMERKVKKLEGRGRKEERERRRERSVYRNLKE